MASNVDTVEDEGIVNHDLEALQNWSITNGMKFNVDKCSVMHCGRLNRNIDYKLYGQKYVEEQSQRRTTKLVRNIKHKSYEERFSTFNLMSTLDRRERKVI